MKTFLRSVREYRRARRMTQSDLARLIGTTQAAVSMIENGTGNPQAETIEALADALGMDVMLVPKTATPQVLALIRSLENPGRRAESAGRPMSAFEDMFSGDDGDEFAEEDRRHEENYRGPKI